MKSLKLALVLTALFTGYALQSAVTIVTVSTEKIIKDSKRGQIIQSDVMKEQQKLTAPFAKLEAQIKAQDTALLQKQKDLAKEDENFKTQASLLSADARADKYDDLQKKHRDLEEEIADFQRAMRKAHEDAKKVDARLEQFYRKEMMLFEQEIKSAIEVLAKSEDWDIVLAKESLIYAGQTTDKTAFVIKKLDEKEEQRATKAAADKKTSSFGKASVDTSTTKAAQ